MPDLTAADRPMSESLIQPVHEDFIRVLRHATSLVPYPWLYFSEVQPHQRHEESGKHLHLMRFVFRLNNEFVAEVRYSQLEALKARSSDQPGGTLVEADLIDGFEVPTIGRQSYAFKYRTILISDQLISLQRALESLLEWLVGRLLDDELGWIGQMIGQLFECEREEDAEAFYRRLFRDHDLGPFRAVTLAQPFAPEFIEPYYFFTFDPGGGSTVLVGAYSGEVRLR